MKPFVLCLFGVVLSAGELLAQSTFGSIVGSVRDPTDSAVPGAVVSAKDLDENIVRSSVSNDQGLYQTLNLRPGRYEITATKTGFANVKIAGIRLEARQELRQDVQFSVASVTETVTISAAVTALNTENATIADSKDNRQITQLPINFRGRETSPLAAILTIPGVQQDVSGAYSIGGGMPTMIELSVDGVSTVSVRSNGPLRDMYPSPRDVERIQSNVDQQQCRVFPDGRRHGQHQERYQPVARQRLLVSPEPRPRCHYLRRQHQAGQSVQHLRRKHQRPCPDPQALQRPRPHLLLRHL